MNKTALDNWITGNQGYDHPDNREPVPEHCSWCGCDKAREDMSEAHPEKVCSDCFEDGIRVCESCSDPEHIDALRIADWKRGSGLGDSWCDTCCENIVLDKPGLILWIENSFADYQYAEQSEAARGEQLPARITCAVIANEWKFLPREQRDSMTYRERMFYLIECANQLCSRFADLAFEDLTGFEQGIWKDATRGNFS